MDRRSVGRRSDLRRYFLSDYYRRCRPRLRPFRGIPHDETSRSRWVSAVSSSSGRRDGSVPSRLVSSAGSAVRDPVTVAATDRPTDLHRAVAWLPRRVFNVTCRGRVCRPRHGPATRRPSGRPTDARSRICCIGRSPSAPFGLSLTYLPGNLPRPGRVAGRDSATVVASDLPRTDGPADRGTSTIDTE